MHTYHLTCGFGCCVAYQCNVCGVRESREVQSRVVNALHGLIL